MKELNESKLKRNVVSVRNKNDENVKKEKDESTRTSDRPNQGSDLGQNPPNTAWASTMSLRRPGTVEFLPADKV